MPKLSRRTLVGTSAAVVAATAASAAAVPTLPTEVAPAASIILDASRRLRVLAKRYNEIDIALCRLSRGSPEHSELDEQWNRLQERMEALEDVILATTPTTPTEATIVLMHAVDQISRGNHRENQSVVERGEFAARAALRFYATRRGWARWKSSPEGDTSESMPVPGSRGRSDPHGKAFQRSQSGGYQVADRGSWTCA